MEYVITKRARVKMSEARNNTGTIAKVKWIALGTGGLDSDGNVRCPLSADIGLNNEIIRKEYSSVTKVSETSYKYSILLDDMECVGAIISEAALIDEEGDVISIICFLPKGKDETEAEYSIQDTY